MEHLTAINNLGVPVWVQHQDSSVQFSDPTTIVQITVTIWILNWQTVHSNMKK